MAGLRGAGAAGEQVTAVEPLGDLGGAHRPGAGGGQLDAERQAVDPPADLGDRVLVGVEAGAGGPRPQHEQRAASGSGKRRHRPHLLAVHAERLAARGEHDDAGALAHEALHQPRGGVQRRARSCPARAERAGGEVLDDRLLDRRAVPLLHPQRGRDGVRDGTAVGQRGQLGEPHAVGEAVALAGRHLDSEPGLPDPPTPTSVTRGAAAQRAPDRLDRRSRPTSAVPRRGRLVEADRVGRRERRVLLQHPTVQRAGGVGRLDAQLVDEPAAQGLVHRQGVGLPSARVEGVHQQGGEGLAVRVLLDQRLQLADHRPAAAQREQCGRPLLDGGEAEVGQARELAVAVDVRGVELVERLAAPQAERGVEELDRRGVVAPTARSRASPLRRRNSAASSSPSAISNA